MPIITLDTRSDNPTVQAIIETVRQGQPPTFRITGAPTRGDVWREIKSHIIPVDHIPCPPWTQVTVLSWFGGRQYHGYGFARCSKEDAWNEKIGYALANRRAEKNLLETIMAAQRATPPQGT